MLENRTSSSLSAPIYQPPPRLYTADGRPRRVGIEIEFSAVEQEAATAIVTRLFGGTPEVLSRFETVVKGTQLGDFHVELDSKALKEHHYREFLEKVGASEALTDSIESVLESIAHKWIPTEIVAPPVALLDLPRLEAIREALLAGGALGTRASVLYTFGFQLNPEVPSLDADSLLRHLRAFLALYDWLSAVIDIDPTRELLSFTDPFPDAYRAQVLDPRYAPDIDTLIDDYLELNPTRNRALDMLPAFAMIDEAKVLSRAKEGDQVKKRPTFHYRLPNCLVDDPRWTFATEWNRWIEIERLAEDRERLRHVSSQVKETLGESTDRAAILDRAKRWGVGAR